MTSLYPSLFSESFHLVFLRALAGSFLPNLAEVLGCHQVLRILEVTPFQNHHSFLGSETKIDGRSTLHVAERIMVNLLASFLLPQAFSTITT